MTQTELATALEALNLPIANGGFISTVEHPAPEPPFIVTVFDRSSDLQADNHNYCPIRTVRIELYTDHQDLVREKAVEALLDSLSLPYSLVGASIESERMYQANYSVQLI